MRGNRQLFGPAVLLKGSIPTHVGKPALYIAIIRLRRVYPHACGETDDGVIVNKNGAGQRGDHTRHGHGTLRCGADERLGEQVIATHLAQTQLLGRFPASAG